jgi:hypothetical protein
MIAGVIAITVLVIVFDKGMSRFVGRFTEWSERGE